MKRLLLSSLLFAGVALAEEPVVVSSGTSSVSQTREESGQPWSVLGPKTLAPGDTALEAFAGYPSISAGFMRGISPGINIGGRVGFVYGVEGMFREAAPGLKIQGTLKLRFLDSGRVSLGMTFEPGIVNHWSYLQGSRTFLALPVGFRLGIVASSAIAIAVLVDFPMWAEFGQFGGFNLPILTGGGVEYFITSQFAAFARARIGPTIRTNRPAEVTFEASVGIGYRF